MTTHFEQNKQTVESDQTTAGENISVTKDCCIPMEQFRDLSKDLDITETALRNFFRILDDNQVPTEDLESTLWEIGKRYKALLETAEHLKSDDPPVSQLIHEARQVLLNCNIGDCPFAKIEELFNRAKKISYESTKKHPFRTKDRQKIINKELSIAAECASFNGQLLEMQLSYEVAGEYYEEAARLTPREENASRIKNLRAAGDCFYKIEFYDKAEALLKQTIAIQNSLDKNSIDLAIYLTELAFLYTLKEKYDKAEPLYIRALAIQQKSAVKDPFINIKMLNGLAVLNEKRGDYNIAESLYQQTLAICEKLSEDESYPNITHSLNSLADMLCLQGDYIKAEPLYLRVLSIHEKFLGECDHFDIANTLDGLAFAYFSQNEYAKAEPLYLKAFAMRERIFGQEHVVLLISLHSLAALYYMLGQYDKTEQFGDRLLDLSERLFGVDNKYTQNYKKEFSQLFSKMDKEWK